MGVFAFGGLVSYSSWTCWCYGQVWCRDSGSLFSTSRNTQMRLYITARPGEILVTKEIRPHEKIGRSEVERYPTWTSTPVPVRRGSGVSITSLARQLGRGGLRFDVLSSPQILRGEDSPA